MAEYNAWQNAGHRQLVAELSEADYKKNRKGFFGSIQGTLNHLLWADAIWMSRFEGGTPPEGGIPKSPEFTANATEWSTERFAMDGRIKIWADSLSQLSLTEDLEFHSGSIGRTVSKPLSLCITHFFNHQTHHRGQIHAMMTSAGLRPDDTDLFLMPTA